MRFVLVNRRSPRSRSCCVMCDHASTATMIATQITTRAPSYFSKVKREHRERLDSQISRAFSRNLRIANIVANPTRVYLPPYENANGRFRCISFNISRRMPALRGSSCWKK